MKILISDKSSPKCAEILQAAGHEVDEIYGLSPEELKNIIGPIIKSKGSIKMVLYLEFRISHH